MPATPSIGIHRYTLRGVGPLNARHAAPSVDGVLLKIDGGHACLQAWPSLGDEPLDVHLHSLATGKPTAMASRALACARVDAAARRDGRWLFEALDIPPSHATLAGTPDAAAMRAARAAGFSTLKLKLGPDWEKTMGILEEETGAMPGLRLRLDFNASLTADSFRAFAAALPPPVRAAIDFVEDPCPFEPGIWHDLQQSTGLRLAADRACAAAAAEAFIGIVKPAVDDADALLARARASGRPMVVTSNMDHPLGIAWAAWHAACYHRAGVLHGPCGLCTHLLFPPDTFSPTLGPAGDRLTAPPGTGFGFDAQLANVPWQPLSLVALPANLPDRRQGVIVSGPL